LTDGHTGYHDRGVVATIYVDPNADGITEETLSDFEDGKYGPIFATNLPESDPRPVASDLTIPTHLPPPYQSHAQGTSMLGPEVPRTSPLGLATVSYSYHSEARASPMENYVFTSTIPSGSRTLSSQPAQMTTGSSSFLQQVPYPQENEINFPRHGGGGEDEPEHGES
jgi:hypothetical protein